MIRNKQSIGQRLQQGMQQKLSPQQLQYIKLLQLNTIALEQRIKEEMELNPILEEGDTLQAEEIFDTELNSTEKEEHGDELQSLDEHEVDWEEFNDNTEYDGETYVAPSNPDIEEWRDLPNNGNFTLYFNIGRRCTIHGIWGISNPFKNNRRFYTRHRININTNSNKYGDADTYTY